MFASSSLLIRTIQLSVEVTLVTEGVKGNKNTQLYVLLYKGYQQTNKGVIIDKSLKSNKGKNCVPTTNRIHDFPNTELEKN